MTRKVHFLSRYGGTGISTTMRAGVSFWFSYTVTLVQQTMPKGLPRPKGIERGVRPSALLILSPSVAPQPQGSVSRSAFENPWGPAKFCSRNMAENRRPTASADPARSVSPGTEAGR